MGIVDIQLSKNFAYRKYAFPHIVHVNPGDIIRFHAEVSEFVVLIDNRDGFFQSPSNKLEFIISANTYKPTKKIKLNLPKGTEKYYSAYCDMNNNYADAPGASPPKIVVM